jgi:hypothetical protein
MKGNADLGVDACPFLAVKIPGCLEDQAIGARYRMVSEIATAAIGVGCAFSEKRPTVVPVLFQSYSDAGCRLSKHSVEDMR